MNTAAPNDHALITVIGTLEPQVASSSLLGPVRDDWEAATLWLDALAARRPAIARTTLENYARELRRLRWYCEVIHPSQRTPSQWSIPDVINYLDFLRDRSGDYLCPRRTAQPGDLDWTPFRARLGTAAQANSQKVLHALFEFWLKVGHRHANPMTTIGSGGRLDHDGTPRQAVPPLLIDQVLELMATRPKASMFEKLLYLRNRFVIRLLQHSGLRANEAVLANMGDVERFDDPKTGRMYWSILVLHGKDGKVRRVPLPEHLIADLRAYRYAFGLNPEPSTGEPLALILSPRTRRRASGERRFVRASSRRTFKLWGEVRRRASLWDLVKGEFKVCVKQLREADRVDDANLLERASTH